MGAKTLNQRVAEGPLGKTAIYKAIKEGKLIVRKHGRSTIVIDEDWDGFLRALPRLDDNNKAWTPDRHKAA
jgi:hypothetical protein